MKEATIGPIAFVLAMSLSCGTAVASDEEILIVLCGLPVGSGFDTYAATREQAEELLAALQAGR